MRTFIFTAMCLILLVSCNNAKKETTQIGENTFVHKEKVFRIIDNEITELGSLNSDSITKSAVLNPKLKDYGEINLDYVSKDATSNLKAVYRGDILYFKLDINGLNDLRKKFFAGGLTVNFIDEYGFQIHSTRIEIHELISIVDSDNEILYYEYNGQTKMSFEVYRAISFYSISSYLR